MEIYFLKNTKTLYDEFLYDKAWIPTRAIYENYHLYAACLHWVLSNFVDPYERFVMLLKSRSRTHHPNMHYSYSAGRHKNMPSIKIYPKMFYSYTGGEPKNMLVWFSIHQINAPSSYWYLSQSFVAEKRHGLCKSYS